ncbi:MAG: hypothetical protein NPIRA01_33070 [Nitrospirales bacterium]|nr:MAG: hypothetical protein NPIRA01_33070 [Nitrospirales bacterium]
MIHKIYASDSRFKTIEFQSGLNVILADKHQSSDEKDSRNGLGKTTSINIIHFCLGANLNKKIFPVDLINDWTFFLEIDLCNEKIISARSISNPSVVRVEGNLTLLPISPETDEKEHYRFFKVEDWKKLLGICLFGLSTPSRPQYVPTFRNLISYFIRTGIDAYSKPFTYFRNQPPWSVQVHNAFLLRLNWDHASTVQDIKDKNKAVTALDKAIKIGIVSSQGELEAERVTLQAELDKAKKALSSFKVHPQYQEIQEKTNTLTRDIHALSNNNLILRRKLERYEDSIKSEEAPDDSALAQLYEEAGFHFGDALKKTLEEAKIFHEEIVHNRKHFLQAEVEEIKNNIIVHENRIKEKSSERAEFMLVLQTHGALEEFTVF